MSMPPEMMKQALAKGMPPANAPPSAPPGQAGPGAAPMMSPQKPEGDMAGARVQVLMAQKLLEQGLMKFGSGEKEGQAILKAITALVKAFGKHEEKSEELMPSEAKQILQGIAGPGQPPGPPPGAGGPPPGGPPGGGAPPMPQG